MSEMGEERPAPVVRLLGAAAAVLGCITVCGSAWAGSATFAAWSEVGRPLRAVPSLAMVAIAAAGAVLMSLSGAGTAAGRPGMASRTGLTALVLGIGTIGQGLRMLGNAGAGMTLALGFLLIALTLLITPSSRFALGADRGGHPSGRGPVPPAVGTEAIDPEIAAAGPPYPYPTPLPAATKAAHIAAITTWQRRGYPWVMPGFVLGAVAVGSSLLSDSGPRARGSAAILWETHTTLAAALLSGGLLLVAVTIRPVIRCSRGMVRHKRLLTAYGVRLDNRNREVPPTVPTSPEGFIR